MREKSKLKKTGEPTRREFMKTTAAAGASLAVGGACTSGEDDAAVDGGPSGESPVDTDTGTSKDAGSDASTGVPTFDDVPRGQVVLVRAETPQAAVIRGVALMGGLEFIQSGQKVMLKPNMTGPLLPPDTTSPAVLVEMIEQCQAAGAGEVIVAERTWGSMSTDFSFGLKIYKGGTKSMRMYVEEAGATYRPLDDEQWNEVSPEGASDFYEPMLIPEIINEVDHMINVPALKTHALSVFTMTMKNLFGLINPITRDGQVHGAIENETDPDRQSRMFAQINLPFHPVLNVMDGIVARTTGGPTPPGNKANTNMILLGKDRVAMDATGLAVLRVYGSEEWIEDNPVWAHAQLKEAMRIGIGIQKPEDVILVSEGIDEISEIEAKLIEV
ncbi:MAG: DUF362 domain-containing protein [Deltaproteobacteria bacterium]|nr:DUF362 domain-containing protein [Deltaproteobacteria bacterium]